MIYRNKKPPILYEKFLAYAVAGRNVPQVFRINKREARKIERELRGWGFKIRISAGRARKRE
jgi:hypothetical protein